MEGGRVWLLHAHGAFYGYTQPLVTSGSTRPPAPPGCGPALNEQFWKDRFWLMPKNSWAELEDQDGLVYTHPQDMLVALPLSWWLGMWD